MDTQLIDRLKQVEDASKETFSAVMRAAILVGLPYLEENPRLVKPADAGMIPGKVLSKDQYSQDTAQQTLELATGRGEATPLKLEQRTKELEEVKATTANLDARLKKIEAGFTTIQLHDPDGNVFNQDIANLHFDMVNNIAKARGVSIEEAYRLFTLATLQMTGTKVHKDDQILFIPVPEAKAKRRKGYDPGSRYLDVQHIPAKKSGDGPPNTQTQPPKKRTKRPKA